MDFLILGLSQLGRWDVVFSMVFGSILGVIVGAIPGAGAAVTIAILLPTTFAMDPLVGITLLLGIYCGSAYGCAIPSVLINVPGSPVAVLTAMEAYPMTLRGEGRRAMSIAYSSSFVGGVVAVLAMIFLTKPLAEFASRLRLCLWSWGILASEWRPQRPWHLACSWPRLALNAPSTRNASPLTKPTS
jgi:putative tricarboxylic transport membrane protein